MCGLSRQRVVCYAARSSVVLVLDFFLFSCVWRELVAFVVFDVCTT